MNNEYNLHIHMSLAFAMSLAGNILGGIVEPTVHIDYEGNGTHIYLGGFWRRADNHPDAHFPRGSHEAGR